MSNERHHFSGTAQTSQRSNCCDAPVSVSRKGAVNNADVKCTRCGTTLAKPNVEDMAMTRIGQTPREYPKPHPNKRR